MGCGNLVKVVPVAGWFLSKSDGPQLHFGAHDYYPTQRGLGKSLKNQETVGMMNPSPLVLDESALLTMIVQQVKMR
jgi:hypothetical protein